VPRVHPHATYAPSFRVSQILFLLLSPPLPIVSWVSTVAQSFSAPLTRSDWTVWLSELPDAGIPQSLLDDAAPLPTKAVAEQEARAEGYDVGASAAAVTGATMEQQSCPACCCTDPIARQRPGFEYMHTCNMSNDMAYRNNAIIEASFRQ
jgi:hypothetical protein